MEILEAFDLTRSDEATARLVGCDPKTVRHHVAQRDAGVVPGEPLRRERIIDPYLEKVEELVERARGDIRADVVHREHLVPMGFAGDERTTRRAVAEAKAAWLLAADAPIGPGCPSPACGCSSTGAPAR